MSCLVQTGRLSDAERYANEILGHLPANPRVQTLPALVLVHTKDEDKQKKVVIVVFWFYVVFLCVVFFCL